MHFTKNPPNHEAKWSSLFRLLFFFKSIEGLKMLIISFTETEKWPCVRYKIFKVLNWSDLRMQFRNCRFGSP